MFWGLARFYEPKITFTIVVLVSIIWEIIEIFMGCIGFAMHGRLTDVIINVFGFIIGNSLHVVFAK